MGGSWAGIRDRDRPIWVYWIEADLVDLVWCNLRRDECVRTIRDE